MRALLFSLAAAAGASSTRGPAAAEASVACPAALSASLIAMLVAAAISIGMHCVLPAFWEHHYDWFRITC